MKYNSILRGITCLGFLLFIQVKLFSQTVFIKPYVGQKWYKSTAAQINKNSNFDSSFNNEFQTSRLFVGIAVEIKIKNLGFELMFASQPYAYRYFILYKPAGIGLGTYGDGAISQFQLLGHYYFDTRTNENNRYHLYPMLSAGLGIGINRNKENYFYAREHFSLQSPLTADSIVGDAVPEKLRDLAYSAIFRAGVLIKRRNKEVLTIQVFTNINFTNFEKTTYDYRINSNQYSGSVNTSGNYYGLAVGIPIIVYRNKHKK